MGEGAGEWYGGRAIAVWDRDCGRAGCGRGGWRRLRRDSIELLKEEEVSKTLETTRRGV